MTETVTPSCERSLLGPGWSSGIYGGATGALLVSLVMVAVPELQAVLFGAIPGLYGLAPPANPLAGVLVPVAHGSIFGVGFAHAPPFPNLRPAVLPLHVLYGLSLGLVAGWLGRSD